MRNEEKRKITVEDLDFLRDLQFELNAQDTCGNCDPRFWTVIDSVHEPTWSENAEYYLIVDDEGGDCSTEATCKPKELPEIHKQLNSAIDHLNKLLENDEFPCEACRIEHEQLREMLIELKNLRQRYQLGKAAEKAAKMATNYEKYFGSPERAACSIVNTNGFNAAFNKWANNDGALLCSMVPKRGSRKLRKQACIFKIWLQEECDE